MNLNETLFVHFPAILHFLLPVGLFSFEQCDVVSAAIRDMFGTEEAKVAMALHFIFFFIVPNGDNSFNLLRKFGFTVKCDVHRMTKASF